MQGGRERLGFCFDYINSSNVLDSPNSSRSKQCSLYKTIIISALYDDVIQTSNVRTLQVSRHRFLQNNWIKVRVTQDACVVCDIL